MGIINSRLVGALNVLIVYIIVLTLQIVVLHIHQISVNKSILLLIFTLFVFGSIGVFQDFRLKRIIEENEKMKQKISENKNKHRIKKKI